MPKQTPKIVEEKISRLIAAWEDIAPLKTFGGMTLDQFKAAVAPSLTIRAHIEALQNQLTEALNQRDDADQVSLAKLQLAINGILADPEEGYESSIYEAAGYTRKSERNRPNPQEIRRRRRRPHSHTKSLDVGLHAAGRNTSRSAA